MANNIQTKSVADAEQKVIESLRDLIKATDSPGSTGGPVDENAIREIVERNIQELSRNIKLGMENLTPEVREFISQFRPIKLELPSGITVDIPDANLIPSYLKIIDDITVGNNVYLYGDAGTGKTTLAENIAEKALKIGYITINCSQYTSPIDIIGGQTITGYKEGRLIEAWKEGKMLILDEIPKLDANTAGLLNDALAKADRKDAVIFNGKGEAIKKHDKFCCIATGNTTGKGTSGKYVGNNKLDLSLIDRFSGNFYEIGYNEQLERALNFTAVYDICIKIREQIKAQNADEVMSLRTMLSMNRIYLMEMERETGKRPKIESGKTLIDSLESYFGVMNQDKARIIRDNINFNYFRNTYRDVRVFREEYAQRVK